jgi:hypothetical protein
VAPAKSFSDSATGDVPFALLRIVACEDGREISVFHHADCCGGEASTKKLAEVFDGFKGDRLFVNPGESRLHSDLHGFQDSPSTIL